MKDGSKRLTLASSVYDVLRRDIVTATLLPESRLHTREISGRFGVGLSPVREALNRLSSDGLVAQRDHRGFVVAPVGKQDLEELTTTRCWIYEIGLRESIAKGDTRWEETIVLAFHRLTRTPRTLPEFDGRNPAWELAHARFHESLIAACGSSWLMNFAKLMFEAGERYRHIGRLAGITRANANEHKHIYDAVIGRDADRAVDLHNMHLRKTAEMVGKALAKPVAVHA
jgi:GntR family transcriptional regulator, carbon starvation induced regulator